MRVDCLQLRDGVCSMEWEMAVAFLGVGVLPVCENLPDITDNCTMHGLNLSMYVASSV